MQLVHTEEVIRRFVAVRLRLRRGSVTRRLYVTADVERPETKTWSTDGRATALFAAVLAG